MNQRTFDTLLTSAVIERAPSSDKQTLGRLRYRVGKTDIAFECKTLELPWLLNENRVSCIPTGIYEVVQRESPTHGLCYHVKRIGKDQVDGREWILIHVVNFVKDLRGCIGVGDSHTDINNDGYKDVTNSRNTLKKMLDILPVKFYMKVK